MERLQRKSTEDKAPVATPVQRRAAAGGEDAAGASAAGPAAGAQEGAESGGSWDADAGLMDAMGLGEGGDAAVAGGETKRIPKGDEGAEGETAQADQAGAAAQQGREQQAAAGDAAAKPADQEAKGDSEEESGEESGEETDEERKKRKQRKAGGGAAAAAAGAVQQRSVGGAPVGSEGVHDTAAQGVSGAGGSLPHVDAIQASFGRHDVSGVQAHTDGAAAGANAAMGAEAYATGDHVAFGSGSPSLHTAAHEAAHVVQQRGGVQLKGGVGEVGDAYERHADAVADQVVQGKSAEGLLDQMAGGSGGASSGVQRKIVQFDIKSDLRSAMDGWGTDEDAIYRRLERATLPELQAVIADRSLMNELRDDLNQSEMARVLDALRAPLPDKLRLAMQGWGTDEEYIHRSLTTASPAELATVAADKGLVDQLEDELSGDDLRTVLDKLPIPLSRRLEYAVRGWGTDESYIFQSVERAPIAEVVAVANDGGLLASVDDDLSGGELDHWRGLLAKRVALEANDPAKALALCGSDRDVIKRRLRWIGDLVAQRKMLDAVIAGGGAIDTLILAFELYWDVDVKTLDGVSAWEAASLQQIHEQLKKLPEQDVRSGAWKSLIRKKGTGGSMNNSGEYKIGEDSIKGGANATGTDNYGVGTQLSAAASIGDATLSVEDDAPLQAGQTIAIDRADATNKEVGKIKSKSTGSLVLEAALTKAHAKRAFVGPDDDTALRKVNFLDATTRHEIAHAVDNAISAKGFYALGSWWTGTAIDDWMAAMGDPWGGKKIDDKDKEKIKAQIDKVRGGAGGKSLADGTPADHPIRAWLGKGVPVIDAAEACATAGDSYWQTPQIVKNIGGKRFSINFYYNEFHYCDETVYSERVNKYNVYSPAEFFAEVYTVYYEQAGTVDEAQYGALVPNSSWRDWIKTHVHDRGQSPADAKGGGGTGKKAGKSGM